MPRSQLSPEAKILQFFETASLEVATVILGLATKAVRERTPKAEPAPKAPRKPRTSKTPAATTTSSANTASTTADVPKQGSTPGTPTSAPMFKD
jgi:hypothetical protein